MEETYSVILTLAYEDATRRNYTFNGVEPEEFGEIKDRILAINADMPANFKSTFVSDDGAQCKMISAGKFLVVREEVIYSAS